ncbi:MAG: hypothetical protein ACOYEL_07485 [Saccharofermentanales bacterium]|jgi:hypothetical protein
MSKRKKITIIVIIIVIILMLIPIKVRLKDGGTVMYKAVLYSYIEYNIMLGDGDEYYRGKQFNIFPFNYMDPYGKTLSAQSISD